MDKEKIIGTAVLISGMVLALMFAIKITEKYPSHLSVPGYIPKKHDDDYLSSHMAGR